MSRPEKPIDWKKVDHLLMAGCKGTEIASHFDMHHDTFYRKVEEQYKISFTAYSQLKREQGDSLLKVKQYEKALEKDNTMMIWLGKQRLDQREPQAVEKHAPNDALLSHLLEEIKTLKDKIKTHEPVDSNRE